MLNSGPPRATHHTITDNSCRKVRTAALTEGDRVRYVALPGKCQNIRKQQQLLFTQDDGRPRSPLLVRGCHTSGQENDEEREENRDMHLTTTTWASSHTDLTLTVLSCDVWSCDRVGCVVTGLFIILWCDVLRLYYVLFDLRAMTRNLCETL